ncbi:4a-hydroxytetrahydrobiopterin dehydratase [Nocardiopsis quinghaiensis]|uniref:4a-hydroxytetrahydrobiopterin dehydratase n=1 Tax=Nocardiopsis quinghaiensis TaxID=464995 RepID=UPI001CC2479A|nr:4a-hydroxytetrahydrobiopterin dehydratase [Nocardiopsis quinghaiensis]
MLSGIHFSEPELADALASRLPEEFAQWSQDPNGAMGRSDTGQSGMPSRLDRATLEHALGRLREWEGDTTGLTRSVDLPRVRVTPLLNRIDRAAHEIDHSYEHEFTDTGIAFTVRTASVGAVTTRDIEMAERIDEAVAAIGSGG